jgi:NAD(P)-dependent dehydrogenase (short-subunit alcohol dehydrogenase family)
MMRFKGKSVLVTGAAGALGSDLSLALAEEGAERLILVDRAGEELETLREKIGTAAEIVRCDVASAESMRSAWAGLDLSPGLDLLVTAAGTIGSGTPLLEIEPEEFDRMLAVNVQGTLLAVQLSLPALRRRKGCIVTYGSTGGLAGSRALGPYSATKGAVVLLTRSLALSLAEEGIRVNSVCPGSIASPMLERNFAAAGKDAELRRQAYLDQHPLKRFGKPREVSEAVMYLASDAAAYSTGVLLPVDGGRLA